MKLCYKIFTSYIFTGVYFKLVMCRTFLYGALKVTESGVFFNIFSLSQAGISLPQVSN